LIRCTVARGRRGRPAVRTRRPLRGASAAGSICASAHTAKLSRLARPSASSSTPTGGIHEKPDRGLAPVKPFFDTPCKRRRIRRRAVQLTNAPQSGMEDDAFGRCCVACMNRRADGCRRYPAICPGAPGGCTAERGGLRPAECRPAEIDMEPADWE